MKRTAFYSFFVFLSILITNSSCSNRNNNPTREQQIEEFRSNLTSQDTLEMLSICDNAMELLKQGKFEQVLAVLYEYNDSTKEAKPISEQVAKRYERTFKMFPVLSYKRQYYSFMLEGCNDVKYEVTFADAEHSGTGSSALTMYMFNPVKINGEWLLCVKSSDDEFDTDLN